MNKRWIEAAGIRAMKTMAQTAIATIGTAAQAIRATLRRSSTRKSEPPEVRVK